MPPIKFPSFRPKRNVYPPDLWTKCPSCEEMLFNKQLDKAMRVCPACGHHFRLPASTRIEQLADPGTWDERDAGLQSVDALGFVDQKAYPDRLTAAQTATGMRDAAVWGTADIGRTEVALCVMDFGFMGGSMGAVVGEKVTRAAEHALAARIPLVVVSSSGGARMQEGTFALMQLAKTLAAIERLRAAGVPFISVLTDPTTGGVFASYAAVGDVNVAEPNALIGFAGARVSAGTISQELPPGFQRSEFLFSHGFVDRVVERPDLRDELARLLRLLRPAVPAPGNGELDTLPGLPAFRPLSFLSDLADRVAEAGTNGSEPEPLPDDSDGDRTEEVWGRVQLARNLRRPRTLEFVDQMTEDFVELHGDRLFGDDAAIVTGLARLDGRVVAVVGQQKGADTDENIRRNFGMPHPEGYRKAIRIMELAERLGLPVITFVDVPGAHPGAESEERGIAESIARSVALMTRLANADRDRDHGRGRLGRGAGHRRGRRRHRPRERGLLGDQPRGLRIDPVADAGRGADGRRRDADDGRRATGPRRHRHRRARARRRRPHRRRGDRPAAARGDRRPARGTHAGADRRPPRGALSALPGPRAVHCGRSTDGRAAGEPGTRRSPARPDRIRPVAHAGRTGRAVARRAARQRGGLGSARVAFDRRCR